MCVHGQEVEFQCAAGTVFDFQQQTCDWSWATTCQLRESDLEGSGEEDIEGSGEEDIEGSGDSEELWSPRNGAQIGALEILSAAVEVQRTEAHKFRTVLDCQDPITAARQMPYRGDCQRYWRCVSGVPQAMFCSDGLFFNERTQQCDFEANSKCVDSQPLELGGEFIEYK